MGKDKKTTSSVNQSTTQTSGLDAASQRYVDLMRAYGQNAATGAQGYQTQGLTPIQQQALQGLQAQLSGVDLSQYQPGAPQQVNAPNLGLTPASPQAYNPQAYQAYMDPYQQQVIAGVQSDFDRQRQAADTAGKQAATAAGAFGGNRGELLRATNIDNVNRAEASALAQLRSQGYQSAQQQAQGQHALQQNLGLQAAGLNQQGALAQGQMGLQAQLANQGAGLQAGQLNLGFGQLASQQNQALQQMQQAQAMNQYNVGDAYRQLLQQQSLDPYTRNMLGAQALGGSLGPYGQTNTSTTRGKTTNVEEGNLMGDILGVGMMGASLFTGGANPFAALFGGGGSVTPANTGTDYTRLNPSLLGGMLK